MADAIRILMLIVASPALVACGQTPERCFSTRSEGHAVALGAELIAAGISHRIDAQDFVCIDAAAAVEAERIGVRVDRYYVGAATLIQSPDHKQNLVSVLDARGKEYSIEQTTDGIEILVLYSSSESEFAENQALLDSVD